MIESKKKNRCKLFFSGLWISLKSLCKKIILNYLIFFITLFVMFSLASIDYLNFYNLAYSVILSSLIQGLVITYENHKNKSPLFIGIIVFALILAIFYAISLYEIYSNNDFFQEVHYKYILILTSVSYIIIELILSYNDKGTINEVKKIEKTYKEQERVKNNREKELDKQFARISEGV